MITVSQACQEGTQALVAISPSPRLDSECLIAHLLSCNREQLWLSHVQSYLSEEQYKQWQKLLARRSQGMPVAQITGKKEFWSLTFQVTPDVLIPRSESELLVETALSLRPNAPQHLLDLGAGSGCLLLSLLHERSAWAGLGIDKSPKAIEVAGDNALRLGLKDRAAFQVCDWSNGLHDLGQFDLILCNPPYIALSDRATLTTDVRDYEPHDALFAGADGLEAYKTLMPQLQTLMKPGAHALMEIGINQSQEIIALAQQLGLACTIHNDLTHRPRYTVIILPA